LAPPLRLHDDSSARSVKHQIGTEVASTTYVVHAIANVLECRLQPLLELRSRHLVDAYDASALHGSTSRSLFPPQYANEAHDRCTKPEEQEAPSPDDDYEYASREQRP
jgi:hypothetical protein